MHLGSILASFVGIVLILISITEHKRGRLNRILCLIGGVLLFIIAGAIYIIGGLQ